MTGLQCSLTKFRVASFLWFLCPGMTNYWVPTIKKTIFDFDIANIHGRVYQNYGVILSHVMDLSKQLIMVEFKK